MKRSIELMLVATAVVLFGFAISLPAQESLSPSPIGVSEAAQSRLAHYPSAVGTLVIPASSLPQKPPEGHKFAAHTNVAALIPAGVKAEELPPFPGYGYETPASIGCAYGVAAFATGCNPYSTKTSPVGGKNSIAIVDAYDDPSAPGDLAWFSLQFGTPLTLTQFNVIWANTSNSSCAGFAVPEDFAGGWELEESLDIEYAHAMAPKANIYLVEACTNVDTDLQQAVMVANNLVNCGKTGIASDGTLTYPVCGTTANPGELSMSWGAGEFPDETGATDTTPPYCAELDDTCFTAPNVVYFASSGDTPGVIWPGTSPNVVSAGGLSNRRNAATFNFEEASAWVYAGGGQSLYETQPSYQSSNADVQKVCGTVWRCVPDLSFDADPFTGVYVYDSFPIFGYVFGPWWVVGGTSVSAPSLAGIINNAASRSGTWAASTTAELTTIYSNLGNDSHYRPIVTGYCGYYMGFTAAPGYNFCGGVGAPYAFGGK